MGADAGGLLGLLSIGNFAFGSSQSDRRRQEIEQILASRNNEENRASESANRILRRRSEQQERVRSNQNNLFTQLRG